MFCICLWFEFNHLSYFFQGSFELFGADFMLTEDMQPWLIEINSSPSMAKTTRATALLVDGVLEDTVKGEFIGSYMTSGISSRI